MELDYCAVVHVSSAWTRVEMLVYSYTKHAIKHGKTSPKLSSNKSVGISRSKRVCYKSSISSVYLRTISLVQLIARPRLFSTSSTCVAFPFLSSFVYNYRQPFLCFITSRVHNVVIKCLIVVCHHQNITAKVP